MPPDQLFSLDALHTVSGASMGVYLIVELIKDIRGIKRIPTDWVAVFIGELLMMCTNPPPRSVSDVLITVLNGALVASAAIGSWHILFRHGSSHDNGASARRANSK